MSTVTSNVSILTPKLSKTEPNVSGLKSSYNHYEPPNGLKFEIRSTKLGVLRRVIKLGLFRIFFRH